MALKRAAKHSSSKNIDRLEKQLSWYKSFFDNATDAVFIVQPDTWSILDANDQASLLLGLTKAELIGSNLPQFRRIFKLLNKSGSPTVLSELTLDTSDNSNVMVEVSASFFEYGGLRLIQAIARDVSEQHAMTDKLVQADKLVLLGQLSAGVAHEIRNPLAAVNLNLQILKRNFPDNTPETKYITTALQGVDRISKIIEVTLNFSRPAIPDIKSLNINSLMPIVLELVSSSIKRKDITIELVLDENLPQVMADTKQLQQVFINLITNAVDAIRDKGKVKISTHRERISKIHDGEYAVAIIEDNGMGIPPEDLTKIFNPFFTRKADGTGLGLPITQRIMHQHNGIIDVESSVGKGTKFYIKLPIPRN